jgi:hypothetical protein
MIYPVRRNHLEKESSGKVLAKEYVEVESEAEVLECGSLRYKGGVAPRLRRPFRRITLYRGYKVTCVPCEVLY